MTILTPPKAVSVPEHYGREACSACSCWISPLHAVTPACEDGDCACHDELAETCQNCMAITADITPIDFGRGEPWRVCGDCVARWRDEAVAS